MTQKFFLNIIVAKPWCIGVLCALIPLVWLWTSYPIALNSKMAIGRVLKTEVLRRNIIVNTGEQGAAYVGCYEVRVSFGFEVDDKYHTGIQTIESCDVSMAARQKKELEGSNITVIYDSSDPTRAFAKELISKTKLKLAAVLSVVLLVLGTWIFGRFMGVYKIDALNVPLTQIQPRLLLVGLLLILFFALIMLS